MTAIEYIEDESLIPEVDVVITLTEKGYIKRIACETYRTQNRGGVGVKGMSTNEEDFVEKMINLSTHDFVLFFTNKGKVYRLKGYEIPEYSRTSKGLPIINLLPLEKGRRNKFYNLHKQKNDFKTLVCNEKGIVKEQTSKV